MKEIANKKEVYDGGFFQYLGFNYNNFKQKEAHTLQNIVEGMRLKDDMFFEGYADMVIEESVVHHQHPKFVMLESFNRKNTYALVYDISESERNALKEYDKLFIYQYLGKNFSYYGYLLYSSETQKSSNHFVIPHDENDLFVNINSVFNTLAEAPKLRRLRDEHIAKTMKHRA